MFTLHAWERQVRIAQVGDIIDVDVMFSKANELAEKSLFDSEAIRLISLPTLHNLQWKPKWKEVEKYFSKSNGDEIWAIVRNKRLVTIMFRRSTQPKTPDALRVKKITVLENQNDMNV